MTEVVRCDVCGGLFSSRHVGSHKRLAHGSDAAASPLSEEDGMRMILALYKSLSAENKEKVRAKLAALKEENS